LGPRAAFYPSCSGAHARTSRLLISPTLPAGTATDGAPVSTPKYADGTQQHAQRSASVRSAATTKDTRPSHARTAAWHSPQPPGATSRPQAPCAAPQAGWHRVPAAAPRAHRAAGHGVGGRALTTTSKRKTDTLSAQPGGLHTRGSSSARNALRRQEQQRQQLCGRARQQLRRQRASGGAHARGRVRVGYRVRVG